MADNKMPPKPTYEFDFKLPYSIDSEDEHPDTSDQEATNSPFGSHNQNNYKAMEDVQHIEKEMNTLFGDDNNDAQHDKNYDVFERGFSNEEDGEKAFDRTWEGHQARKATTKQKKSSRRSEDHDGNDKSIPTFKRPRKSLFGGHIEEREPEELKDRIDNQDKEIVGDENKHLNKSRDAARADDHGNDCAGGQDEDLDACDARRPDIRQRMLSLNLDQQKVQNTNTFEHDFGLGSSKKDSISPPPSRALSEDSVIIPPDNQFIYPLRRNINRAKAFTYIDTDKTGNYDPTQEARLKALRMQKAKAAKAAKKKDKDKNESKGKEKAEKENVMKCIVRLRFKAYGNVRNYINDEDRWPEGWSEVDSDSERQAKKTKVFYRRNTPNLNAQVAIKDARDDVDDLTGHPSARGCQSCREQEVDCSMVEGGTYPCDNCDEDETECIPILETLFKGGCKQCVEDGQGRCSFEDNPDKPICDYCSDREYICNPLPPRGYKTPRNSIDDIMYSSNRKHVTCTFCRIEKKKCSLKKKTDRPPCKFCKKHGIGCTFYDLPSTGHRRKAATRQKTILSPTEIAAPGVLKPSSDFFSAEDLKDMMRNDEDVISRKATPEIEMEDDAGNKGLLTKIKTPFAHPINFNVEAQEVSDCNFCEMPLFGFVGHFEREVHVIQWYSGLGYTETGGGYCEDKGATKMCTVCTLSRLQILCCPGHRYQAVSDETATPDFDAVAEELMLAEPASSEMRYQLQRWCSMCFSVATHGCINVQPSLDECDEDTKQVGCGLRLCDNCVETLRHEHAWDFEDMAAEMDWRPNTSEEDEQMGDLVGKARADVGFLRQDGLLMRNIDTVED